jgi:hypothetical protein
MQKTKIGIIVGKIEKAEGGFTIRTLSDRFRVHPFDCEAWGTNELGFLVIFQLDRASQPMNIGLTGLKEPLTEAVVFDVLDGN